MGGCVRVLDSVVVVGVWCEGRSGRESDDEERGEGCAECGITPQARPAASVTVARMSSRLTSAMSPSRCRADSSDTTGSTSGRNST